MPTVEELVVRIFESRGFTVGRGEDLQGVSGAMHTIPIYAVKGEEKVAIDWSLDPPRASVIASFAEAIKDVGVKGVYVTVSPLGEKAKKAAPDVVLWSARQLENEIGKSALSEVEGVDRASLDMGLDLRPQKPAPKEPKITKGEIIRPKLSEGGAIAVAKPKVGIVESLDLDLVPYYVLDYTCDLLADGNPYEGISGTVRVNALTRQAEKYPLKFETTPRLTWRHIKLEPKIELEEAKTLAQDAIVLWNQGIREVSIRKTATTQVIAKKTISVAEGGISFKNAELYYVPVWKAHHGGELLAIDATTGEILE